MSEIVPFNDLQGMSAVMAKSNLFGKNQETLLALMLIAQAEGIHPAAAAMEYDIVNGKPALKAQSALARFQKAGGVIEWVERTTTRCVARFSHPQCPKPVEIVWDIERAKRMGLAGKDNWKKQPEIMLQWRVVAEGVRACYPACLNRMYLDEEVVDFDPLPIGNPEKLRNVTPTDGKPPEQGPLEPPVGLGDRIREMNAKLDAEQRKLFSSEIGKAKSASEQATIVDRWEAQLKTTDEPGVSEAFDAALDEEAPKTGGIVD